MYTVISTILLGMYTVITLHSNKYTLSHYIARSGILIALDRAEQAPTTQSASVVHCTLYIVHCTLYTVHWI